MGVAKGVVFLACVSNKILYNKTLVPHRNLMTLLTEGKSSLFYRPQHQDILGISGENFTIRDKKNDLRKKIPALSVRDLVIFGETNISSKIFTLARKHSIPIHFLNGRGKLLGTVRFDYSQNVFLRKQQNNIHDNKEKRLLIAKKFLIAKINNQNIFLQKIRLKSRLKNDHILSTKNLESLRGTEGAKAKQYFDIWKTEKIIKNHDFKFSGRWKRPPLDEVNALLSFSYSLLHAEILTQIMIAGLDPYIGFLHNQHYGHAALASDFLEIYRGIVDQFIVKAINLQEFVNQDFQKEGNIFSMNKNGFAKFFPKWSSFLRYKKQFQNKSLVATIEHDVRQLVHYFMNDTDIEKIVFFKFRF